MPTGRQYLMHAPTETDMNDWIALINYASAFKTAGIRMRPPGMTREQAKSTGTSNRLPIIGKPRGPGGYRGRLRKNASNARAGMRPTQRYAIAPEGSMLSSGRGYNSTTTTKYSSACGASDGHQMVEHGALPGPRGLANASIHAKRCARA